jgi:hypothetical protein
MTEHKLLHGKDEIYKTEMGLLHSELKEAAHDLQLALLVVSIQLMLPINLFHKYYFFKKTNRKATGITINELMEYLMFFTTALTFYKWLDFQNKDLTNSY